METSRDNIAPVIIARERIALAAGAALLVAGIILVVAVLPAEYGVDPTGIGRRLGLTAMSDVAKMTEKFRRRKFGTMEIELTIDDPKVYTKPFTVTLAESLEADTELVDEICLEGEKDYERLQRSRGK